MKLPRRGEMNRRDLIRLAAVSAAAPVLGPAHADTTQPHTSSTSGSSGPVPSPVVQTKSGRVQGLITDGVVAFKGIRYGAAPIGKKRFMPPEPAEPWST